MILVTGGTGADLEALTPAPASSRHHVKPAEAIRTSRTQPRLGSSPFRTR
jgi:hypothetical protein